MSAKRKVVLPLLPIAIVVIPILVVVVALVKIAKPNNDIVYAKLKVSQGLWWSTTANPDTYFLRAITKGDAEYNLLGTPDAQILSVRYYPSLDKTLNQNKYDIYLTLKLAANYNTKTQKYTFKRGSLVVGVPLEIETNKVQITGTVMEVSPQPFADKYEDRMVFLTKKFGYPWEYDSIKVGDTYFDGEDTVFEVLAKNQRPTSVLENDYYGNFNASTLDSVRYISVKARIKVLKRDSGIYLGEEKLLNSGSYFNFWTPNFNFQDFVVGQIQ